MDWELEESVGMDEYKGGWRKMLKFRNGEWTASKSLAEFKY